VPTLAALTHRPAARSASRVIATVCTVL